MHSELLNLLNNIFTGLVLMLFGAIGTGVIWLIKRALKIDRDMDFAHDKLRDHLEKLNDHQNRILDLEETTYIERDL